MSNNDFTDLIYDQETGIFYRIKKPTKAIGCIAKNGYVVFPHKGKLKYAHRVAWSMVYKQEPPQHIDHINRIKTDFGGVHISLEESKQKAKEFISILKTRLAT